MPAAAAAAAGKTLLYARVSCSDQKDDRKRLKARLMHHSEAMGWSDCELIADLGSGPQFGKGGLRLLDLLLERIASRLVVEDKHRWLRFGADLVFRLCRCLGIEVAVVDAPVDRSFEADLARNVLEIITVFSARLDRARSAAGRKNTAPAAI